MARKLAKHAQRDEELATPLPEKNVPMSNRGAWRKYTDAEKRQYKNIIEELYLRGRSRAQVADFMDEKHGVGSSFVDDMIHTIKEEWAADDAANRAVNKSKQIRRIERNIELASGRRENGKWVERPNFGAMARFEELLSDIQGTKEPIKIDVDVRANQAMLQVISGMREEEIQGLLAEYEEMERLSTAYKQLEASSVVVSLPSGTPHGTGNGSPH